MVLSVQKISASGVEEVYRSNLAAEFAEQLSVLETESFRLVFYDVAISGVWLGDFQLQHHNFHTDDDELSIFSGEFNSGDLDRESKKPISKRYFAPIFMNSVGFSVVKVEHSGGNFELPIEIISNKVDEEELYEWVSVIADTFPIFKSDLHVTPVVRGKALKNNVKGAKSLSTLISDITTVLTDIKSSVYRSGYLASLSEKLFPAGAFSQDYNQHKFDQWFQHTQNWKPTSLRSNSIVKKGMYCFEPTKFAQPQLQKSFNHPLNSALLSKLAEVRALLARHHTQLNTQNLNNKLRGSQFSTKESRADIQQLYREMIIDAIDQIDGVIVEFRRIGIKESNDTGVRADNRYQLLQSHFWRLTSAIGLLRGLDVSGDEYLGLPSTDEVFEQFCYASIVNTLEKKFNFKIVESGLSFPVNYYLKLENEMSGEVIRILYDIPVFKSLQSNNALPFFDGFKYGGEKRPDFTIHIQHNSFESVVILDAKYMPKKNVDSKFKDFNGDNLLSKYGTKFSQNTGLGFPAIFIGAIYPAEKNNLDTTCFESLLEESVSVFGSSPALQQIGISSLSSVSVGGLTSMIESVLFHSRNLQQQLPGHALSDVIKPAKYEHDEMRFLPARFSNKVSKMTPQISKQNRSSRSSAPTIDEYDARLVKGMLLRGDKQQDISLFFGVNPARVTEIKQGTVYDFVEALPFDQLPPQGPYPLIRDFMGFKGNKKTIENK